MKRVIQSLDRIGSAGALLAAVAAPCCFPIFAAASTALGLGALGRYETVVFYLFQAFAVVSLLGLILAFRKHRQAGPLLIGFGSIGALAYNFYWSFSPVALYSGLTALLGATLWNYFCSRQRQPILWSTITCPECGHRFEEIMPTNACLFFYGCPACNAKLRPLPGDCCVFCSYGSVRCPPMQLGDVCCG